MLKKTSKLTGQSILFDEASHTYLTDKGRKLISVTTFISQFKNKFDPYGNILKKSAAKKGITPEELQKEWDKTRDDANAKGTKFHSDVEHFINTGKVIENENKIYIEQFKRFKFEGELFTENIVYSEKYGIAGTIDLLELVKPEVLNIGDFKTNKSLDKKDKWGENLKFPLHHMSACNFNTYTLQLSIYAFLLEEELGYWINKLKIYYINPRTGIVEEHPVKFLRKEVQDMFKHKDRMDDPFDF